MQLFSDNFIIVHTDCNDKKIYVICKAGFNEYTGFIVVILRQQYSECYELISKTVHVKMFVKKFISQSFISLLICRKLC